MEGLVFSEYGEPAQVLSVASLPVPKPGPGEVLVRMLASPINPSDLSFIRGHYREALQAAIWNRGRDRLQFTPFDPREFGHEPPGVPGVSGVGVVEQAGGTLSKLLLGRRVMVIPDKTGCWCEKLTLPAAQVVPVPRSLPTEQAAMLFVNPMTALVLVDEVLGVRRGQLVLQTAANSAVGRMIIRLGRKRGFKTINVVRGAGHAPSLRDLGAEHVISTETEDIRARVAEITHGKGVPYALDCVGGDQFAELIQCLAPAGRLITYGTLAAAHFTAPARSLMVASAAIEGFMLSQWLLAQHLLKRAATVVETRRLLKQGIMTSPVERVFPFRQIGQALAAQAQPARSGKIVLRFAQG